MIMEILSEVFMKDINYINLKVESEDYHQQVWNSLTHTGRMKLRTCLFNDFVMRSYPIILTYEREQ